MTAQLDPWELNPEASPDEHVLSKDCWCEPEVIPVGDDFQLGTACDITDTDCEACQ